MAAKKIAKAVSGRELGSLGYAYWKKQPTIDSGHFDNLKYDDGKHRVWVSRMTQADYGEGREARTAWLSERLTVERLHQGSWEKVWP